MLAVGFFCKQISHDAFSAPLTLALSRRGRGGKASRAKGHKPAPSIALSRSGEGALFPKLPAGMVMSSILCHLEDGAYSLLGIFIEKNGIEYSVVHACPVAEDSHHWIEIVLLL